MTADIKEKDSPGVIAPPPLIYTLGLGAGYLVDEYIFRLPLVGHGTPDRWEVQWAIALGVILFAAGGMLDLLSLLHFRKAKTDVRPWKPTTAIIRGGPFRYSRNPIYVGMTTAYVGCAFLLDSWWVLAFLLLVLPVMQRGVILREEAYLEAKFADDYLSYKRTVRRWV